MSLGRKLYLLSQRNWGSHTYSVDSSGYLTHIDSDDLEAGPSATAFGLANKPTNPVHISLI